MQTPAVQRRLMAILAGDMVGYSRLMEIDEAGTFARLKAHRLEIVNPAIASFGGRIIKTTGDGMLVEFTSAADAVRCAVEIQRSMKRRNADVDVDHRIRFRIGINLGDVIIEDGDVYGDGVNIAARLEQLADADGIAVSQVVRDQMANQHDIPFEDLGEQQVKNISRAIRAYRAVIDDEAPAARAAPTSPGAPLAHAADRSAEHLSIAVLPFANMSGDPDQEFFADGLTEDILTELARFRDLTVISRNSTFVFKGQAVNIQKVSKDLGVRYVVEGSVRKAGNRVRITVQLIDAATDKHVWAERYDRDLADIFEIQDEVTSSIVATLPGRVEAAAQERVKRKTPENLDAYECTLAAKVLHHRSTREDNRAAHEMINRAIELDPNYAHAHAWRACILGQSCVHAWCEDVPTTWNEAFGEVEIAMKLDDTDADVHRLLAAVGVARNDHEAIRYHQERGLSLNPNYDLLVVQQGEYLTWIGNADEGIEWILRAMRLNPHHPERFWGHLARAYFVAHRYADAIEALRHIAKPDKFSHALLAAAHTKLGNEAEAAAGVRAALAADPDFSISAVRETLHYKHEADLNHCLDAMSEAGIPR